jgi:hypothetical protein
VGRILMIMSQTYYFLNGEEKVYVLNHLKDHSVWQDITFWERVFIETLNDELENKSIDKNSEDYKNIVFSQISGFIYNMIQFNMSIKAISEWSKKTCEKYKLESQLSELIMVIIIIK